MTTPNQTMPPSAGAISTCQPPSLFHGGYLLLDPGAFRATEELTPLHGRVCVPTNWSGDLTGLPMLIDLRQCGERQVQWLESIVGEEYEAQQLEPLSRPRICAHLKAPVPVDALASHLANQMLVLPIDKTRNRSGQGALWRFFDPRVFANLCWLLNPDQLAVLLAPVSTWAFPWFGNWFAIDMAANGGSTLDEIPQERIAGFTPIEIDLWARAQRIALVNQVLARLALPRDLSWAQRAAQAMRIEPDLAVMLTPEDYDHLAQRHAMITEPLPPADTSNTRTLGT